MNTTAPEALSRKMLHRTLRSMVALGVLLVLMPNVASATSFVMVADEVMVEQAPIIVEVEVLDVDRAPGIGEPVTDYRMAVDHLIVGAVEASPLTVRVRGGVLADGTELWIDGAPRFVKGQRALLFLKPRPDGTYRFVQFMLGAFHLVEVDGRKIAMRDLSGALEINLPGKAAVQSGPRDLESFRAWVEDRGRGIERAADYFVEDTSGAVQREFLKFSLIDNPGIRFREFDSNQNVLWRADSQGQPGVEGDGFPQFQTALGAWRADAPINYFYSGTTGARGGLSSFDGINAILFEDRGNASEFDEQFDCSRGGVIAVGGPWFLGSHTFNGNTYSTAAGADIVTNRNTGCFLGVQRGAEEVFAHELGHTLGLGHSNNSDALMFAEAHGDNRGAALKADDRAGIRFLYGNTVVVEPPDAPSNLSASAVSTAQVNVNWTDRADNETSYEVERRLGSGSYQRIATLGANRNSYVDTTTGGARTYAYRVRARNSAGVSGFSNTASVTTPQPVPCVAGPNTLCLNNNRFTVEVDWRDFNAMDGTGTDAGLGSADSGLMWFFDPVNWEMLVKVLDGCAFTNHFWVFAAATTTVAYDLVVTDSMTGFAKTYSNALGNSAAAITDTAAFATCDASAQGGTGSSSVSSVEPATSNIIVTDSIVPEKQGVCTPDATTMCLKGGRFEVKVDWEDFEGNTGSGQVDSLQSGDSGLMYFFDPQNLEMLVKVLDGCAFTNRVWVFAAATTNVQYTLQVTDTVTGAVKRYTNPLGNASDAITDTNAFLSCS